jgi:hypothetical protein
LGDISHYATLSYCWGDPRKIPFIRTTEETFVQRKTRIEWGDLPKTFQDAIIIIRALEIHFIWIDSLCILQDDELDWEKEAAKVANIYSNSYLNIAATGSSDSGGGCLS